MHPEGGSTDGQFLAELERQHRMMQAHWTAISDTLQSVADMHSATLRSIHNSMQSTALATEQAQKLLAAYAASWGSLDIQASFARTALAHISELPIPTFPALTQVEQFADALNSIQQAIAAYDWSSLKSTLAYAQRLAQEKRVEDAFEAADLLPAPSMTRELIDEVVDAFEGGADAETLSALVARYYDENDSARLENLVAHLRASPDFVDRQMTLDHVLAAHLQRLDTITTHPLVAMIEGVLIPFLSDLFGKKIKHNDIADTLDDLPANVAYAVGIEAFTCCVTFMKAQLYQSFDWLKDVDKRNNYIDLNRHRLLHGMAKQGTRMNTLRCFLILDVIADLLPLLREDIAAASGDAPEVVTAGPVEEAQ